jgi:hypothetical protein
LTRQGEQDESKYKEFYKISLSAIRAGKKGYQIKIPKILSGYFMDINRTPADHAGAFYRIFPAVRQG